MKFNMEKCLRKARPLGNFDNLCFEKAFHTAFNHEKSVPGRCAAEYQLWGEMWNPIWKSVWDMMTDA